ncbi:hypothetical protein P7C73_g2644, partial [Tremellales sp. Uapishka_1]
MASLGLENHAAGPSSHGLAISRKETTDLSDLSPRQREKRAVSLKDVRFDEGIDQEITLLISQYLESKAYTSVSRLLDQEVSGSVAADVSRQHDMEAVERAIQDGDYLALESLLSTPGLLKNQSQKAFMYMCWRQQFLEFVENRESQKAFNLLQKRLKPLEHYQPVPYDFYNLAYLTSASTVHDAPSFRDWAGVGPERVRLVEMWKELTESERKGLEGESVAEIPLFEDNGRRLILTRMDTAVKEKHYVPPDRLVQLLKQAAAWQIEHSGFVGSLPPSLPSRPFSMPNQLYLLVKQHPTNVKCVDFLGDSELAVSGSSDSTLRIFSTADGTTERILSGHSSRVWDCSSSFSGRLVASASGDGDVRIWSTRDGACRQNLKGDGGDLYSVKWRPGREDQVVSAGYDKILRCWDVEAGKQIRTFSGHNLSTLAVAYDPTGNTIASGSKDKQIRLWDAVGGVCFQSLPPCLGEITSVCFDHEGKYLLAGCKDNSNRLWDLRMMKNIYRYTGHQNTSKNIIRSSFASPSSSVIVSGSEDGLIYTWEREGSTLGSETGPVPTSSMKLGSRTPNSPISAFSSIQHESRNGVTTVRPSESLEGHMEGAVFDVKWSRRGMISAGEDGNVGLWRIGDDKGSGEEEPGDVAVS